MPPRQRATGRDARSDRDGPVLRSLIFFDQLQGERDPDVLGHRGNGPRIIVPKRSLVGSTHRGRRCSAAAMMHGAPPLHGIERKARHHAGPRTDHGRWSRPGAGRIERPYLQQARSRGDSALECRRPLRPPRPVPGRHLWKDEVRTKLVPFAVHIVRWMSSTERFSVWIVDVFRSVPHIGFWRTTSYSFFTKGGEGSSNSLIHRMSHPFESLFIFSSEKKWTTKPMGFFHMSLPLGSNFPK